jgi:isocitrate dehydrogenase
MTKDLALLVGKETKWLTTQQFLDCLDQELSKRMD